MLGGVQHNKGSWNPLPTTATSSLLVSCDHRVLEEGVRSNKQKPWQRLLKYLPCVEYVVICDWG